jgi:Raf kinase inhibitor-like YbhB/YbcL family protein
MIRVGCVAGILVLCSAASYAQSNGSSAAASPAEQRRDAATAKVLVASQRPETAAVKQIVVTTHAFPAGGAIPPKYSSYGESISPDLSWESVAGAKSYAVIMEDPEAPTPTPHVHWVAWNIPAGVTNLAEGVQKVAQPAQPAGMVQGTASSGVIGYYGPHPPAGDAPHHYHIQVFALDTTLDAPPASSRDVIVAKMKGHVLAKGEVVGTFGKS